MFLLMLTECSVRFLTFLETAEPEAILSEEDLAKLMGEGQSSEVKLLPDIYALALRPHAA